MDKRINRINLVLVAGILFISTSLFAQKKDSSGMLIVEPYKFRTYDGREHDAEFGKLWVKENRHINSKRIIQLSFVRLKSLAENPSHPIIFLAGGPGAPGIGMGRVPVYFNLFNKLREISDVILFDQRGSGLSVPSLVCTNENPAPDIFKNDSKWLSTFQQVSSKCAEEWKAKGVDLRAYTTESSADDLDDLRKALGAQKISLIGHSYGTVLAQAAVRRHGNNLGKLVFANTEGSDDLLAIPEVWDVLLKKLFLLAKNDTSVNSLVPDFEEMYRTVLSEMEKQPVQLIVKNYFKKANEHIVVGKIGLQWIVRNFMGDARAYAKLPAFIYTIYKKDYSVLTREIEPLYNGFTRSVMATAIDCAIGWSPLERTELNRLAKDALFSNVNLQWSGKICDLLGIRRSGDNTRARIFSELPALFISGTLDTNTPAYQAEEIRWGFPNSHHLIIENGGHESLPSREVQSVIFDFFKGIDISNRSVRFSIPNFISPDELRAQ